MANFKLPEALDKQFRNVLNKQTKKEEKISAIVN